MDISPLWDARDACNRLHAKFGMAENPVPARLSREVLKWIQALQLSIPVKNIRRDFSNGFLVAEIFSRYFEHDIEMHSFDNGHALRVKRDNWEQLTRFFQRRQIEPGGSPVTNEEVEDIIHARGPAVTQFINRIYEFLSGRRAPTLPPPVKDDFVPAYARPTASRAAYSRSREPRVERTSDETKRSAIVQEAVQAHEATKREERIREPERFIPDAVRTSRAHRKLLRGSTHRMRDAEKDSIQEVKVRQVGVHPVGDEHMAARKRAQAELRASSFLDGTGSSSVRSPGSPATDSEGFPTSDKPRTAPPSFPKVAGGPSIQDLLEDAVKAGVEGTDASDLIDTEGTTAQDAFLDAVAERPDFSDEVAARVLDAVRARAAPISASIAADPSGMLALVTLFNPLLTGLEERALSFAAAVDAAVDLGAGLQGLDPRGARQLFADFMLPGFTRVLRRRPAKRHALLRIAYAFTGPAPTARAGMIATLEELLNHVPTFLHCVAVMVFLEDEFNDALLETYSYYCALGLTHSAPTVRGASVAMIAALARQDLRLAAQFLPRLLPLRDDAWWEVKAQVLIACTAVLERLPAEGAGEVEEAGRQAALSLVEDLLAQDNGSAVLRVGVSYLASTLENHPSIRPRFIHALLDLPHDARERMLNPEGPPDELPLLGASGSIYTLPSLPPRWPALAVGLAMVQQVQEDAMQSLEVGHFQTLLALLRPTETGARSKQAEAKEEEEQEEGEDGGNGEVELRVPQNMEHQVFDPLREHVVVGIYEPSTCALALEVMRLVLFFGSGRSVLLESDTLHGSLILMHRPPSGEPYKENQQMVAQFFEMVAEHDDVLADAVAQVLARFLPSHEDVLRESPLCPLAQQLGVLEA